MKICLNNKDKCFIGLLIWAVLIFVCFCMFSSSLIVSSHTAYAAFVVPPVIEEQPVGYSTTYNDNLDSLSPPDIEEQPVDYSTTYKGNLDSLSVTVSHIVDTVTFEYAWYAKKTGENDFSIVGTERICPISGVSDNGSYYCLIVARDTNSDVSEEVMTDTIQVNILKCVLYASINNAESFYGDTTATLSCIITKGQLVASDTMLNVGINLSKTTGNGAGTYQINGSNDGENYFVIFTKGVYTIKPKDVDVIIANKTSVYGESLVALNCDLEPSSTLAFDDSFQDLGIELFKENGLNARRYAISGTCSNVNYKVNFILGEYTIAKRTVMVFYDDYKDLVYSGKIQSISCTLLGTVLLNDEANISIMYNKTPKNADSYIATAIIDNNNYAIVGGHTKQFDIAKKPLTISLNDTVINEGITPSFTYKYTGFVDGENADNLLVKPKVVNNNSVVGEYELMPIDALSNNYLITFVKGKLQINKTSITSLSGMEGGATGSFAPSTTISVVSSDSHTFHKIASKVTASYKITIDGNVYTDTYKLTLKDVGLSRFFMRAVIEDEDGILRSLRSFDYKDGDLIVETNCQGNLIIYNDYLPISAVAGTLILLLIIVSLYLYKDKRKFKNASAMAKRASRQAEIHRKTI